MSESRDPEVEALKIVYEALKSLPDDSSRERVLSYAASRFKVSAPMRASPSQAESPAPPGPTRRQQGTPTVQVVNQEIGGVAKLTGSGELKITARDLKASSANDAAVRLAHITIYAAELLKGEDKISSRDVLVPILKAWRAYDPNTRTRLAGEKGIVRDGDDLSLDQHSRESAKRFVEDILNPDVVGKWSPSSKSARKRGPTKKSAKRA